MGFGVPGLIAGEKPRKTSRAQFRLRVARVYTGFRV